MHIHTLTFFIISVNLVMTLLSQSSASEDNKFNSTSTSHMYDWASSYTVLNSDEYLESHLDWSLVSIGRDTDNLIQYVGRTFHENELLPGKIKLSQDVLQRLLGFYTKRIYVTCDGEEHEKSNFEGLYISPHYKAVIEQVNRTNTHVPARAVIGGISRDREVLYIGAINIPGVGPSPGKIVMSAEKIYGSWGGREYADDITNFLVIEEKNEKL